MMKLSLIWMLFLSLHGHCDEETAADLIAPNYEAGPFLIYDCEEKHWVCVKKSYFNECEEKRDKDFFSESYYHSCAPIGEFPTKRSCFQRQLFMTSQNHGQRFCVKEIWKTKNIP